MGVSKILNYAFVSVAVTVVSVSTVQATECDSIAGEKAFAKCIACHSTEPGQHLTGPSLYRVVGRKAGSAEGFLYSVALEESQLVWDAETLSAFLENPMVFVPGSIMPFAGLKKAEERQSLVCWLAEQNVNN
jgi:cytochrome c